MSLFAQATIQPVPPPRPTHPIVRPPTYPSYGYGYGYSRPIEPTYTSAKQQREQRKQAFEEENAKKNSMTGQTRRTTTKTEQEKEKKPAKSAAPAPVKNTTVPVARSGKALSTKSFARINIVRILNEQVGVPYSSDGETPEEGFSPVGLIKYVARKLGIEPKSNTPTEAWERAGILINAPYGKFETGDLLFFKLYSKSTQKGELFLALALDDKYMVYPSFSRKKVVKRSYLDDFWKQHFKGVKRIPARKR